jgi:hypothetical protein
MIIVVAIDSSTISALRRALVAGQTPIVAESNILVAGLSHPEEHVEGGRR